MGKNELKICPSSQTKSSDHIVVLHETPRWAVMRGEPTMKDELPKRPLLTRRGAVRHINDVIGVPLKLSSFSKLAMLDEAPEPDAYYGKVQLYKPENVERWAQERLLSRKPKLLDVNGRKDRDAA
jgi:hypothetical protein